MIALMEEARAIGVLAQGRLEAEADHHVRGLGRRGAGAARLDRVGRGSRRRSSPTRPWPTSTPTCNGRGLLDVGGSHSLERFANEIAQVVSDPAKGGTVGDRADRQRDPERHAGAAHRAARLAAASRSTRSARAPTTARSCSTSASPRSTSASAARAPTASTTRSTTRSTHFERFMDPDYAYGVALAKVGGRTVLRLADADLLPFEFTRGRRPHQDATSPTSRSWRTRCAPRRSSTTAASRTASSRWRPTRPRRSRRRSGGSRCRHFDFAPLTNAVERLTVAARRYDAKAGAAVAAGAAGASIAAANGVLLTAERALTRKDGLPRRPWFRHQIYAPGFYTGYGVKTLPAVREAIEERDFARRRRRSRRSPPRSRPTPPRSRRPPPRSSA